MKIKILDLLPIIALAISPTFLIWLPFFLRLKTFWNIPLSPNGLASIVANYDGPLYLVVSKTFYSPELIKAFFEFPLPIEYYAAHFPLFPALIRLLAFVTGFPYAMLTVTVLSSVFCLYFFNKFIKLYLKPKDALFVTFVFALFPARWLIVRSVGSPEPLFIGSVIASVFYFKSKKYLLAGIWGAIAQITKSPGVLLFLAYLGYILFPHLKLIATTKFGKWIKGFELSAYPILLMPLSLILVFFIFKLRLNDFWAYFNSGDNLHLFFPPFQIFNYSAPWVGTFWLEEVIFVYLLAGLGLANLISKKERVLAWFVGVFLISIIFVSHRDIIRYALPISPFLFVGFKDVLIRKEFKLVFALLIIPIYLFSLAFISQNVMPISDWSPFL